MPILTYPEDRPALASFRGIDYGQAVEEAEPTPALSATIGAAFRQDNVVGSIASNKLAGIDLAEPEDGFSGEVLWGEIQGTPYAEHWDRFSKVFNRPAFDAMKAQIDMETEDRRTLAASGWAGVASSFGAAVFDVPSLIPGGALVRGATVGATVARSALSTATAGALGAGVSELALQATQQSRPLEESALAVGGGAVLGGLLGAGVGALYSKAERAAALRAMSEAAAKRRAEDQNLAELRDGIAEGQSAGAAAVERPVLEDFDIAGMSAGAVGKATAKLNPLLRAAQSPSAVHRSIMSEMAETGYYLERNGRGEGSLAVESTVKYWDRGALTQGLTGMKKIFEDARKTGLSLTPDKFREAVSRAMRRNDEDALNPAVADAARKWRATLFDPLKDEAIEAGILPADVQVKTATSYLTRLWNAPRLNAGEGRFKEIVRPWLDDQLSQLEFKADEIRIGNRIVDAEKTRESFEKATARLDSLEDRIAERRGIRERKGKSLEELRGTRFAVMAKRAPKPLVEALRGADETSAMIDVVRDARKAERSANKKKSFGERNPILATIRAKGGARVGSKLDNELRAMGVTPKTNPGLFVKRGGIGDVDNFVKAEDEIFADLPDDGAGYVNPVALMEALRDELAGNPLRTADELAADDILENLDAVASEWLASVGLPENATVKDVRALIGRVLGAESNLEGMDSRISRFEREIEEFDEATDRIVNERLISETEAKTIREELNKLETELEAVADLANASPRVSLVVDYATTRRDLFKNKLTERTLRKRVDALKRLDAEGNANDEILAELAAKSTDLGRLQAAIEGLKAKADKLEPMVPKVKQELPEFLSPEDRADYVNGIVDDIFSQLTGRANRGMPSYDMTVSSRGPLKERTFNIPDHLIEEFLEHDIELIARRYARVMAADVELARLDRRLGGPGKPDLQGQIDRIRADYNDLRTNVINSAMDPAAKEAELARLAKREKNDVDDVAGVRDLLRGQYKVDSQHTNFARVLRGASTFNFIRTLGGVLVSSLTDAVRPAMVHGMGRYMSEGIAPLMTNLKAVKMSVEDAKLLGAVTERTLQSRLATMAELADPYASNSPFERFLDNASNIFAKMTLLPWWNDMHKSIASVLVQNRVLKNALVDYEKLNPQELRYMGFLGIDKFMGERIAKQFQEFGQVEGNVHIPGVEDWTDEGARRAFAAALNKDVDSIIVTKGVADVPLFSHTPAGRALLQFKTFALASNQRVLMRGLQDGPGSMVTGIVGMSAIGILIYWLKQRESGREVSDNPGTLVAEGLDRSGIFSIGFEINNTWEKLGGYGLYRLASGRFASKTQQQPASRYVTRDTFGALLGPSFQLGSDVAQVLALPARVTTGQSDLAPADINRLGQMIPFQSLLYWRWLIEGGFGLQDNPAFRGIEPELKALVEEN
jgi:hypothetical protein